MKSAAGPEIHAVHPWTPGKHEKSVRHQLLSDDERAQLAKIARIVRFNKGALIYQEGDTADAAFNIISGVVTAFRIISDAEHVLSFLYPGESLRPLRRRAIQLLCKSHDGSHGLQDASFGGAPHLGS
jgi:hypothetical protein